MNVTTFLTEVSYALRGIDDDAPEFGDEEATYWLATLNRKKNELYDNVTKQWRGSYDVQSQGTITASTSPTYNLSTDFIAPSNEVYVITADDRRVNFDVCLPQERTTNKQEVFVAGLNPQVLEFTNEIEATDDIVGGTLWVPGYYRPADLTASTDELPLPDPYWGVMAVAAEVAGSDVVYEDKEANLNAKANALYRQMVKNNRRGTYNDPIVTPTNVTRIRSTEVK